MNYTDINIDYVCQNLHLEWNWNQISMNPNDTTPLVDKYSNAPWNVKYLYLNPHITFKCVVSMHLIKPLNDDDLSTNLYKQHPFIIAKSAAIARKIAYVVLFNSDIPLPAEICKYISEFVYAIIAFTSAIFLHNKIFLFLLRLISQLKYTL
jgi:hypothetical protein